MAQELKRLNGFGNFDKFGGYYDAENVDAILAEKDSENRRLKRVLWVTRTAWAKSEKDRWDSHVDCGNKRNRKDPAFVKTGKLLGGY